jgi:hypothetical protein
MNTLLASVNENIKITGLYFHNIQPQSHTAYVQLSLVLSISVKQNAITLFNIENSLCNKGTHLAKYQYCKITTNDMILQQGNFTIAVKQRLQCARGTSTSSNYNYYKNAARANLYVGNDKENITLSDDFVAIVINTEKMTSLLGFEYSLY